MKWLIVWGQQVYTILINDIKNLPSCPNCCWLLGKSIPTKECGRIEKYQWIYFFIDIFLSIASKELSNYHFTKRFMVSRWRTWIWLFLYRVEILCKYFLYFILQYFSHLFSPKQICVRNAYFFRSKDNYVWLTFLTITCN